MTITHGLGLLLIGIPISILVFYLLITTEAMVADKPEKDRLTKWAMKEYPNWHEIDIQSSTAP